MSKTKQTLTMCTGCGHFSTDTIPKTALACCPDSKHKPMTAERIREHYMPIADFVKFRNEMRRAFMEFHNSAGCGCCSNHEKQENAKEKIGILLEFDRFGNGETFNFYDYPGTTKTQTK